MKNPEPIRTSQRPSQPVTGRVQRKPSPEPASHLRYAMRALRSTAIAFMAPTLAAPFLPAALKPVRLVASGLLYADLQQQPKEMRFNPAPGRRGHCIGMFFGLMPFIPAFALQAHLTETWCARQDSMGARIAGTTQAAWNSLCEKLPKRVAAVASHYPINFVLARCVTQALAALTGSGLSAGYHRTHGRKLVACKLPAVKPRLQQRVKAQPHAYVLGGTLFLVPALLDSRISQSFMQKAGIPRMAAGSIITSSLVGAALTTANLPQYRRQ